MLNLKSKKTSIGCIASNEKIKVSICDGYFYVVTRGKDGKQLPSPKKIFKEIPGHTVSEDADSGETYIPLRQQDGSVTLKKVTICKILKKSFKQKDGKDITIITECPDLGNISDKEALDLFIKLS